MADKTLVKHIKGPGVQDTRDGVISVDTNNYKMYMGDGTNAHEITAAGDKNQIAETLGEDVYVPQSKVFTITPEEIDIICSI